MELGCTKLLLFAGVHVAIGVVVICLVTVNIFFVLVWEFVVVPHYDR
jgi:hypothetical protein